MGVRRAPIPQPLPGRPPVTHLGTSARSSTAMKKPPVSVVLGEARRQCSAPGKAPRPRCGQEGRTGASLQAGGGVGFQVGGGPLPTVLADTHYLKAPGLCCRAARTTSSFSSWQTEHVE